MNNLKVNLFIGILLEEDSNRNYMRVSRRKLRDELNPFEMPRRHFIRLFRLDQASALNLIRSLEPHIPRTNNINKIPLEKKVLATLHFLADGSFQNAVGSCRWLSLSQSSMCRAIGEICSTMADHLLPTWVKFPTTVGQRNDVKRGFYSKFGLKGVIGAIDGTHVEVQAPPQSDLEHPPYVYVNTKGKHSINVMLISDSNAKIIGCSARFPGSVHDSEIWQVSTIKSYLRSRYEDGDKASHLIGDSGYPLEPWLFIPFHNPRTRQEAEFNRLHASSRKVIEQAIGILKGRFRCLSRFRTLMYHPLKAANIIYACCVLHNIALVANLELIEEELELPDENENEEDDNDRETSDVLQLGKEARAKYTQENF